MSWTFTFGYLGVIFCLSVLLGCEASVASRKTWVHFTNAEEKNIGRWFSLERGFGRLGLLASIFFTIIASLSILFTPSLHPDPRRSKLSKYWVHGVGVRLELGSHQDAPRVSLRCVNFSGLANKQPYPGAPKSDGPAHLC